MNSLPLTLPFSLISDNKKYKMKRLEITLTRVVFPDSGGPHTITFLLEEKARMEYDINRSIGGFTIFNYRLTNQ